MVSWYVMLTAAPPDGWLLMVY